MRVWLFVLIQTASDFHSVTKSNLSFLVRPVEEELPYHQKYEHDVAGLETWIWMDVFTK